MAFEVYDATECALIKERFESEEVGVIASVLVHCEQDTGVFGLAGECVCFGGSWREGLFDQDMFAGFYRSGSEIEMRCRWSCDDDNVDIGVSDQVVGRGVDLC